MRRRLRRALLALALLAPLAATAGDAEIAALFARHGATGSIVVTPLDDGPTFTHDDARTGRRYPAASTFKILNTLIALEEGVVTPDEVLAWDGVAREIPEWNRDHTLASAFAVSCVWCYQALAGRIGAAAYRRHLAAAGYGELREPFATDTFWLDGALRISAREQVDFLKRLHRRSLPFGETAYATLRRIMVVEQTAGHTLRAKTGWATRLAPPVGWYVGEVETPRGVWFFALNIDTPDSRALPLRQTLVRETLRYKGIID